MTRVRYFCDKCGLEGDAPVSPTSEHIFCGGRMVPDPHARVNRVRVMRSCNGCGRELRPATREECDAAVWGRRWALDLGMTPDEVRNA